MNAFDVEKTTKGISVTEDISIDRLGESWISKQSLDDIATEATSTRGKSTPEKQYLSPFSCRVVVVYICCLLNFISIAITLVAAYAIVNVVVNGDANINSSQSAFVNTTVYFLANVIDLLCEKYNAALSDYVGRKPMLLLSQLALFGSRVILLASRDVTAFYFAGLLFGYSNYFYNVCIAWLCDVLRKEDTGKAFGLLIGVSIGLGFTIGLPIGAVLSVPNPYLPVQVSLAVSVINVFVICLTPLDDTLSYKARHQSTLIHTSSLSSSTSCSAVIQYREWPSDLTSFLTEHSLFGVIQVIKEAKVRSDWCTVFFMNVAQQVLQLTFILFGIQVFRWTTAGAGIALAFIGIAVAIVSPVFLSFYEEISMITLGSSIQVVAYTFLAIIGAQSIQSNFSVINGLGYLAIAGLAFGGLWISSLQAVVLRQYAEDRQGEVAGSLGQINLLAVVPAYPISLLFVYTISTSATFYWPGIIYAMAGISLATGLAIHCYAHSRERLCLNRRVVSEETSALMRQTI